MAKRKRKITLNEFRAWLEGVEELQPKDWAPNLEQWKLIRDKIDLIKEEPKQVVQNSNEQRTNNVQPQQPNQVEKAPAPAPAPGSGALPPPPPVPSSIPDDAANATMSQHASKLFRGAEENGRKVTPDIDTSSGGYGSTFE